MNSGLRMLLCFITAFLAIVFLCAGTLGLCLLAGPLNGGVYCAASNKPGFREGVEATLTETVGEISAETSIPTDVILSAIPDKTERQSFVTESCAELPGVISGGTYSRTVDADALYNALCDYARNKKGSLTVNDEEALRDTAADTAAVTESVLRVFDADTLANTAFSAISPLLKLLPLFVCIAYVLAAALLTAVALISKAERQIWLASVAGCAGAAMLIPAIIIELSGLHGASVAPVQLFLLMDAALGSAETALFIAGGALFAICAALALYGRKHKIRGGVDKDGRPDVVKDEGQPAEDQRATEHGSAV